MAHWLLSLSLGTLESFTKVFNHVGIAQAGSVTGAGISLMAEIIHEEGQNTACDQLLIKPFVCKLNETLTKIIDGQVPMQLADCPLARGFETGRLS